MTAASALSTLYARGLPRDADDATARTAIARAFPRAFASWRHAVLDAHRVARQEHTTGTPF